MAVVNKLIAITTALGRDRPLEEIEYPLIALKELRQTDDMYLPYSTSVLSVDAFKMDTKEYRDSL